MTLFSSTLCASLHRMSQHVSSLQQLRVCIAPTHTLQGFLISLPVGYVMHALLPAKLGSHQEQQVLLNPVMAHRCRPFLWQVYYAGLQSDKERQQDEGSAEGQRQKDQANVVQSLQALTNILQAVPKLTALMASRPALTPLLNCIEPICRSAALCLMHSTKSEPSGRLLP